MSRKCRLWEMAKADKRHVNKHERQQYHLQTNMTPLQIWTPYRQSNTHGKSTGKRSLCTPFNKTKNHGGWLFTPFWLTRKLVCYQTCFVTRRNWQNEIRGSQLKLHKSTANIHQKLFSITEWLKSNPEYFHLKLKINHWGETFEAMQTVKYENTHK